MNLAELGAVLTVISAGIVGGLAAHDQHAGWTSLFFAAGGLILGICIAHAFGRLAFAVLDRSGSGFAGFAFCVLYFLIPPISIFAAIIATLALTSAILRHFQ